MTLPLRYNHGQVSEDAHYYRREVHITGTCLAEDVTEKLGLSGAGPSSSCLVHKNPLSESPIPYTTPLPGSTYELRVSRLGTEDNGNYPGCLRLGYDSDLTAAVAETSRTCH